MTETTQSDLDLVERVRTGDDEAFVKLMQIYEGQLVRFVSGLSRDSDEREDVVQITRIRAHKAITAGGYDHRSKFSAWLAVIAKRVFFDLRRKERGHLPLSEFDQTVHPGATAEVALATDSIMGIFRQKLAQALGFDPDSPSPDAEAQLQYYCFLLYYVDGMSAPEILDLLNGFAPSLGVPAPTPGDLNNWLSGGRLLKKLLGHLIETDRDTLDKLTSAATAAAGFTPEEQAAWDSWGDFDPESLEKDKRQKKIRDSAKRKVVVVLVGDIFDQLHDSRKKT